MTTLQFSLFFVALLVGYVLVHLRLVRFEQHLRQLSGIRSIDDRLKQVDERLHVMTDTFSDGGLQQVAAQLDRLHEQLELLREATAGMRQAIVEVPQPQLQPQAQAPSRTSEPVVPSHAHESVATRIVGMIETRLLDLGYRNLRLLGDLSEVQLADAIEVRVEADRNGMPCKGRVWVRNGSVRDVDMQTVAQAFP